MDIRIHNLTEKYNQSFEEIYIRVNGNFDSIINLNNFRKYIRFKPRLVKIAIHSSKIIGYIIGDQNKTSKVKIFNIYVLPQFQLKGIGRNLIKTLEKEFITNQPNLRYLYIRIPENFFNFERFFLKQGFEIITRINCYVKISLNFPYNINSELKIRSASRSDINNLVELEKACFTDYWCKSEEDFLREIESNTNSLFLAFFEGKLVGYNSNATSTNRNDGYYARIATHPEYRRRGIGTSLTVRAFQWFKEQSVKRILLSTFSDSNFHNTMYRKWGFRFYEQELIMAKRLRSSG